MTLMSLPTGTPTPHGVTLPRSRPLTYDDLESMPDDGHRYELIDGTLIVSPAPSVPHQRVIGNLHVLLRAACPDDLEAPFPLDFTPASLGR